MNEPGNHKLKLYNPVADVGRGLDDLAGYVRATAGDPYKGARDPAPAVGRDRKRFFTYGQPLPPNRSKGRLRPYHLRPTRSKRSAAGTFDQTQPHRHAC